MWEILDVLKRHHRGESQRRIAAATGRGRKTIRAYIREAKKLVHGYLKFVPGYPGWLTDKVDAGTRKLVNGSAHGFTRGVAAWSEWALVSAGRVSRAA